MKKQLKKIIITGAAGEVGLNLISLMHKNIGKEYEIIAIDKNSNNNRLLKKLFPKVNVVTADLAAIGDWQDYFRNAYAVIQLQAQISSPDKEAYIRNNWYSVRNVVKASEKYGVKKIIHASSSQVVSVAKDNYTITKKEAEKEMKKCKVPYMMLRPTLMFGCFDIKHTGYLIALFDQSPIFPMPGSGKYLRQPLYVIDFCRIMINCLDMKMDNKAYDITGKEKIMLIDMLKLIYKRKNKKILFLEIPLPIFYLMIRIHNIFIRKSRIIAEQLKALTAGDIFQVTAWEKKFHVKPTNMIDGIDLMVNSKYYKYGSDMTRSNE